MFSIDRWLPEQLKGINDRWQALQARVFVVLLLLFILPVVPAALVMGSLSALHITNLWSLAIVTGVVSLAILACYYYFSRTASLAIASAIYAVLALMMVGAVILYTGGWNSPVCVFLLTLPVLVSLVLDQKAVILYAVLVLLFYILLFMLHRQGYPFQQVVAAQYLPITKSALWGVTLFSIVASLLLYDFSETSLSAALAEDRARLERHAHYDELTGIFNEQALFDLMEQGEQSSGENDLPNNAQNDIQNNVQNNTQRMLAYIAVENISGITNHFGFEVADMFIKEVVKKIQGELMEGVVLARYSTNGFVIFSDKPQDKNIFSGMVYRIKCFSRTPLVLSNGYRFLLLVQAGIADASRQHISSRELIDQARSNITYEY